MLSGEETFHLFLFGKFHSHQSGKRWTREDRALFGFIPAKNCSNILTRCGPAESIR